MTWATSGSPPFFPGASVARATTVDIRRKKAEGVRIAMITAYDFTFARLLDGAGADMILVGDSLGMVVQGQPDTLPVTLDEMIYHTRCVSRGLVSAHLTTDLPFLSYQVSPEQALLAAGRALKEGGAQSVKLEGGAAMAPTIARLVEVGIPVVGHVGLTPQSVHAMGGFRVQGRTESDAARVLADAVAVAEAGAFCVVLEGIPSDLAAEITAAIQVPTIGIGAGAACDGQVLVCYDLLGLDLRFQPRFVKRYAELETTVTDAVRAYIDEVKAGVFPGPEHGFTRSANALKRVY